MHEKIVRNILYPAFQMISGRKTLELLSAWEELHTRSPEAVRAYQLQRLKAIISWAGSRVPYYRRLWGQLGVDPGMIQALEDIGGLPMLSKSEIRSQPEDFRADDYSYDYWSVKTGGSTGEPLSYTMGQDAFAANQAALWRARRWWGLDIGQPNVNLWGHSASLQGGLRGELAGLTRPVKDWMLNRRNLSAYELSPESLTNYWETVCRFQPVFIRGYTTSLFFWAKFIQDQGLQDQRPDSLRAVITTSEMLYGWQREQIQRVFGCPVVNEYGSNEAGVHAYSCPAGSLHLMDENLYLEVVRPDRVSPDEPGEVVITQLHHLGAPLIRYRTGDVARGISRGCSCGSHLRVLEGLLGRANDLIVTPEGQTIHGQFFIHLFKYVKGVRKYQVVQERRDLVAIRIVLDEGVPGIEEDKLVNQLRKRVSSGMEFRVDCLAELPAEESGKYRWIRSEVSGDVLGAENL